VLIRRSRQLYYNLKYIYIGLWIVSLDIQTDWCCVWCLDFCMPNLPSSQARLPGCEDLPSRLQPFEQISPIFMSLCDDPVKQWLMCNWLCIYTKSPIFNYRMKINKQSSTSIMLCPPCTLFFAWRCCRLDYLIACSRAPHYNPLVWEGTTDYIQFSYVFSSGGFLHIWVVSYEV
jgi:hypothetical protein